MSDQQPSIVSDRIKLWSDQIVFWVGMAFVLLAPIVIGLFTSNATIAWLALIGGAFVTLMSRFESLAELTLGPMKVKMRDSLLRVTLNTIAAANAEAKTLPDSPSKNVITTTTSAAMEAVTAAIKANSATIFTTSETAPHIVTTSALYPGGALGMAAPRGAGHSKPQEEK
jgi:hypothetical protein